MLKRIVVGVILIALVAVVLWMDWWMDRVHLPRLSETGGHLRALPLTVLMVLIIVGGYLELARMAASAGLPIFRYGGMVCTVVIATLPFWRQALSVGPHADAVTQLAMGAVVMLLFVDQLVYYRTEGAIQRIGVSLLAVCYLGVCAAVLLGLRIEFGVKALLLLLAVVKAADIGAYFVGSAIGRHKLIPWLSPGKSWEGLVGGVLVAGACGAGFALAFAPVLTSPGGGGVGWVKGAVLGLVLGALGQGADLCESAIKRDAGLKDSGRIVPGFGGVLDIIDSPLLAAPVGYVLLALMR